MSLDSLTGLGIGLAFGSAVLLLVAAIAGWTPVRRQSKKASTSVLWGTAARKRALVAVAVGVVVLMVTRWPVAAGAGGALIYLWPTMFGGGIAAARQMNRLEALATWTESLRDSIAGSVGLEDAIRHSVNAAPQVLQAPLSRMVSKMRVQIPLPQALASFAEEFEDSSAEMVIAVLILNSKLRGPGLVATLTELATTAREEIDMRRRIEENRKSLRRTALIIVATTAIFAGGMVLFSRDYVAPYNTPIGQMVLLVVLAILGGGLALIRSASTVKPPERFLVGVDEIDTALLGHGNTMFAATSSATASSSASTATSTMGGVR